MPEFRVGSTSIVRIPELDLNDFEAAQLLPGFDPAVLREHPDWFDPRTYDPVSGRVFMSVHSWLVRHEGKVILVDTGAGNDKDRPGLKVLDHLRTPYIERLQSAGVRPEDVDYVLLTHIHADHVGWNTRWDGKSWVPTFPNATVICSDREWRYGAALAAHDDRAIAAVRTEAGLGQPIRVPEPGVFHDSMLPMEAAGRIRRVAVDGREVLRGVRFLPTAGHSIDHAAISITSEGAEAIFGGDVVHHPFELNQPNLVSMFCEFPEAAKHSRQSLARHVLAKDALYFSSHFPASSAGNILQVEESFAWKFL